MAVSVANVLTTVEGTRRVTVNDVTMDNSYQSGGEPLTKAQLGFGLTIDHSQALVQAVGSDTVNVANAVYDPTAELLHVYDETPAEVASTNDLTGVVIRIEAKGH